MRFELAVSSGAVLLAALALSAPAAAQPELRLGGGMTLPVEPDAFTDLYDYGFHGGAELTAGVNRPKTTHLGIGAYHHRFPLDEDGAAESARVPPGSLELEGGTYALTEVFFLARFDFTPGATRPHFLVGVGGAHQDITAIKSRVGGQPRETAFAAEIDPMFTLGAGFSHRFGRLGMYLQARLTFIMDDAEDTLMVPITGGVVF